MIDHGTVLRDLGDLACARAALERALAIREAVYGHEHPDTAHSLWSLGILERDTGDTQQAGECLEEALSIFEKSLPPDHPSIKTVREDLESLE